MVMAPSGEGLVPVEQLVEVDVGRGAHALARRARAGRQVEAVVERRPRARHAQAAEHDPQHRVGVGRGAHRGPGVGAHPLLVDDDRRGQPFEQVDVGAGQARHETLHEGAVGLVDQPLRLGGDRAEHERALARAGHPGEHRQPALRDVDVHVLQVVLPGPVDLDQVMAVCGMHPATLDDRTDSFLAVGVPGCQPAVSQTISATSCDEAATGFAPAGSAPARPR